MTSVKFYAVLPRESPRLIRINHLITKLTYIMYFNIKINQSKNEICTRFYIVNDHLV